MVIGIMKITNKYCERQVLTLSLIKLKDCNRKDLNAYTTKIKIFFCMS